MGRKAEQNRLVHKEDGVAVEQTAIYDDSLLPPADELAKLQALDPNCIDWVKRRTEIEQDARIKFNMEKIVLMKKDMKHIFIQNLLSMFIAFIIIVLGIACSAFFVYKGLNIEGTIFGGFSIVLAGSIFMRWKNKTNEKE